jgi:uncharacterized protein
MQQLLSWTDHRVFTDTEQSLLFAVDQASLFSLSPEAHQTLIKWRSSEFIDLERAPLPDRNVLQDLLDAQILLPALRRKECLPLPIAGATPLSTLVLEVAQDCNLRCTYCYAEAGTYGAAPCLLEPDTARQTVRHLIDNSGTQQHLTLIFFGGEPLLNMPAIRAATSEAASYGRSKGKQVHFSITTNGTLLDEEIVAFLHTNRIAVAVSLDGPQHIHDRNRPDENGEGSYAGIVARLGMLLKESPVTVAARVTLAPDQWHAITEVFDHLIGLGFHEVGIAPASPVNRALLPTPTQQAALLEGFGELAKRFVSMARQGQVLPFSNVLDLLGRIHLGQTRALSCGAGFGYMAVDAKGDFFPCHRLAGQADFRAGSLACGVSTQDINTSLDVLNEGREQACSKCWARTLCVGGCHYENHLRETQLGMPRGTNCKFIRDWLSLGIRTYAELSEDGTIETLGRRLTQRAQC